MLPTVTSKTLFENIKSRGMSMTSLHRSSWAHTTRLSREVPRRDAIPFVWGFQMKKPPGSLRRLPGASRTKSGEACAVWKNRIDREHVRGPRDQISSPAWQTCIDEMPIF